MIDLDLFLGFPVTKAFLDRLSGADPHVVSLFIGNDPSYLVKKETSEGTFIGRFLGREIEFEALKLAEANVMSLLKRVVPNYPYQETSLVLFPIPLE